MNKGGQVTIFVIIAILIVVGGVIVFVVKDSAKDNNVGDNRYPEVRTFVSDCIERVGEEAILEVSLNGGYIFPPIKSTAVGVPVYLNYGENNLPKISEIENEISKYVSAKLFFCTQNFVDFPGLDIEQGEILTDTKIMEGFVQFDVDYPITITSEDVFRFEGFNGIRVPARLNAIYELISEFIVTRQADFAVCMSCLLDMSLRNDVYVNMVDGDDDEVLFFVRDKNIKINEKELLFVFANKYESKNE